MARPTARARTQRTAQQASRVVHSAVVPVRAPIASAMVDLADDPAPSPAPTATLLVATDPNPPVGGAPDESLLLGAPPVPTAPPSPTTPPASTTDPVETVSWVDDIGTWGTPLLVGAALLLALTGPTWLRRLARRRSEA